MASSQRTRQGDATSTLFLSAVESLFWSAEASLVLGFERRSPDSLRAEARGLGGPRLTRTTAQTEGSWKRWWVAIVAGVLLCPASSFKLRCRARRRCTSARK